MRLHLISLGIGFSMLLGGFLLWSVADDVHLPFIELSRTGVVLMALGAFEVVVTGAALALPSTRHEDFDL